VKICRLAALLTAGLLIAACAPSVTPPVTSPPPSAVHVPTATSGPAFPADWINANGVMAGLCFASVWDAAGMGQIFNLRSAAELTALFDAADHSGLCPRPVLRGTFDFSGGRRLIGLWSRGRGCTAHHVVTAIRRDDIARVYAITIRPVFLGGCAYELVQPFWIGLDGLADYDVRLLLTL